MCTEVIKTRYQASESLLRDQEKLFADKSFNSKNTTSITNYPSSTIIKTTNIHSLPYKRPSIIESFRHIIHYKGIKGLFTGLVPNLVGVAPSRAIYFFAYGNTKSFLVDSMKRETPLIHVTSAAAAGIAMSTCTNPLWFIKTRLQLDLQCVDTRTIDLIRKVYREDGIRGFYKGISASYVGVSETIVHFVIYEQLKAQIQLIQTNLAYSLDDSGMFNFVSYLGAASCSKLCASTLCYPHEVIRTRLREEGTKYKTFMQTFKTILKEESYGALYRGLLTHLIRQIPNTAIMMATYEIVVAFLSDTSPQSVTLTEVSTLTPKRVLIKSVDNEVNATIESEM
ncbi:unnamed protein product [Didymodactylos carnosus]|uniref:Mitochondrial carrier protein n=1 Tax=Didymodactylos carnosus TaxID=1234261 RepID=A0A814BI30_9BILA|nr:unnamed protein product [Didymodactylos carnosus]CAF0926410.1 unnamed protein product [Didymodactylos carnosus]CAF3567721.1 unnamed protein product [Didymodactylos carnosus]CAF3704946.1 unnamed protein product [Didymodactylos carnosus]